MHELDWFLDLARSRRSVRRYQERAVPRATLELLLEAAQWAPSAHNRQPWRFAVIETALVKQRLAAAMGERLRADLERDGAAAQVIEQDTARSYQRICSAPVVIVVCLTVQEMDRYPDERRTRAEYLMAAQSAAMATQNLLLAAHAAGLGACWLCAPLFVPDTVRGVLELDADWEPQALLTLGYPAEDKTKTRVPLQTVARFLDG